MVSFSIPIGGIERFLNSFPQLLGTHNTLITYEVDGIDDDIFYDIYYRGPDKSQRRLKITSTRIFELINESYKYGTDV